MRPKSSSPVLEWEGIRRSPPETRYIHLDGRRCNKIEKNTAFCVRQNRNKPLLELQERLQNVLEHHFDRHDKCGKWCPAIKYKDDPEKLAKLCYRDKDKDMATYLRIKKIRAPFLTLEKLEELRHPHDTNKCEAIMRAITRFHPKDLQLCATICAKGRIYAAVSKDSVGMGSFVGRIFAAMGVAVSETTFEFGRLTDAEKTYNKEAKASESARMKRSIVKSIKQRENYKAVLDPKMLAFQYRSGQRMEEERIKLEGEKEKQDIVDALAPAAFELTGVKPRKVKKSTTVQILWWDGPSKIVFEKVQSTLATRIRYVCSIDDCVCNQRLYFSQQTPVFA
jgi:hypothetical protein